MKKVEYEVKNLDCAGCAGKIQHKAGTMAGVLNANLDLPLKLMKIMKRSFFYMRLISLLIL